MSAIPDSFTPIPLALSAIPDKAKGMAETSVYPENSLSAIPDKAKGMAEMSVYPKNSLSAIGETLSGMADKLSPMADKAKGMAEMKNTWPPGYSTTRRRVAVLLPAATRTA
ncbi:hypothetical protein [Hymenobacter segetis]